MYRHMKSVFLVVLVLFLSTVSTAWAGTVRVSLEQGAANLLSGLNGVARFEGEKLQFPGQAGEPCLPYQVLKILLPSETRLDTVSVSLEDVVETDVPGLWNVEPVQPMATWDGEKVIVAWPEGRTIEEGRDVEVYGRDVLFPEKRTLEARTGEIRGWKVVDVPVALFRYNPVTRRLVQLESAEVVVEFLDISGKTTPNGPSDPLAPGMVRGSVVNFDQVAPSYTGDSKTAPQVDEGELPGYVILTTEAIRTSSDSLDEFVTHKGSLGFDVHIFTEGEWGGSSGDVAAENLRSWLADNYQVLNLQYVLLVGNPHPVSGDVPMKMLWPRNNASFYSYYRESPSDTYYADLTGNWDLDGDGYYGEWEDDFGEGGIDTNWEVVVGRIPFYGSTADLDSILAKTIRYETTDPSVNEWRQNVLLPMEPSDFSTPGYHLGEAIKADVLLPLGYDGFRRVYDEVYDLNPAPEFMPCNVDNVTGAWTEDDFGLVAWWTHGSSICAVDIMDVTHTALLDNLHPSFVFQCSCLNAYPEVSNNLSYSLLKNGAVVTVGATRVSWYYRGQADFAGTSSNSGMTYGFSKKLLVNDLDAGTALASLKQQAYASSDSNWMNFTDFNIYGDPSMKMDVPDSKNGRVTVNIDGPPEARWLFDRQDSYNSGDMVKLSLGSVFEISFSDVDGWIKPEPVQMTIPPEGLNLTYTYQERILDGPTFVKPGGRGDGSSWNCPTDLAEALRKAMSGETILVAEGIYRPKYDITNNLPLEGHEREASFTIKNEITLMGGFPADLTGIASDDRDPDLYRTVLTGDLDADDQTDLFGVVADSDDIRGENACHVISCSGAADLILDGITVTGGASSGYDEYEYKIGAGIYGDNCQVTLNSCVLSGNFANDDGGAMYFYDSTLLVKNSAIHGNASGQWGGGIFLLLSEAELEGCVFNGNFADINGGGLINSNGECSLINCTFHANEAGSNAALGGYWSINEITNCTFTANRTEEEGGRACFLGNSALVKNSIFWNDTDVEISGEDLDLRYSIVRGGLGEQELEGVVSADHVISADPCLGPLADNGGPTLTCVLLPGSSALDSGTSEGAPSVDQRGIARPQFGSFDIGACEDRPGAVSVSLNGPSGAFWNLDGNGRYSNRYVVNELSLGTHTVDFLPFTDWEAPGSEDVVVYEGHITDLAASYSLDVEKPSSWSCVEAGDHVVLTWDPFTGLADPEYQVYMEEDGSFVPVPAERVEGTSVTLDLNGHTEYTLRVDADGFQGQPWSFITPNRVPRLIRRSPGNGAARLPMNTYLSWQYIDPDGDPVDYGVFMGREDSLSLVYSGDKTLFSPELSCDLCYNWQLVASDRFEGMENFEPGITTGDVWTFTVTNGIYRLTDPISDDVLIGTGINDIWIATLDSTDLAALEEELGEPIVTGESFDLPHVSSVDISPDQLEREGIQIDRVLNEGFNFALTVSDDVNLVAVPVSLKFSESQLGNCITEENLLDHVHLFVLAEGRIYDLVSLAGERRGQFFHVYSDSDESGLIYFVDFRICLAGRGATAQKQLAPLAGSGSMNLLSSTVEPSFLLEGSRTGNDFQFSLAEATLPSDNNSGGGGCSAHGFAPCMGLLLMPLFMLLKK